MQIVDGTGAAEYYRALQIGWSHSLLTGIVWAAAAAAIAMVARYSRSAAVLIGIAVISHWLLDAVSHPPDMPLLPGGDTRVGLGLWRSLPLTLFIEGGCWLIALGIYATSFPAKGKAGLHGFWGVTALLTLVWYNNVAGAPPPDPKSAPLASLILFALVIAWAYWIDTQRQRA